MLNNLPRVALDSGEARIRTRDLCDRKSSVLTTRPPSHMTICSYINFIIIIIIIVTAVVLSLQCEHCGRVCWLDVLPRVNTASSPHRRGAH